MNYIEAPSRYLRYTHQPVIFLAGGITNCPDWQRDVVRVLESYDAVVLNPRRAGDKPIIAEEQIKWEFEHLRVAGAILFWFPQETLCPISLFEYGKMLATGRKLFVGTHPDYQRRLDLIVQTQLEQPSLPVYDNLNEVIRDAITWIEWSLGAKQ